MSTTEQIKNFMGVEEWEWQRGNWGAKNQAAKAEQFDSKESHIASVRNLRMPLPRTQSGDIDYTSKEMFEVARADNTKKNLDANFWQETASLLRWATTFSLAGIALASTKLFVGGALTLTTATVLPLAAAAGVALVAGTGLFVASRKARKLVTEKIFDDGEFRIQRQSQLIGQSVEQERSEAQGHGSWQSRINRDVSPRDNWAENVLESMEPDAKTGPAV